MSTYRRINGERVLVDEWRRRQTQALRRLCDELERPVAPEELAEALGVPVAEVTHMALVQQGHALLRTLPDGSRRGLWPREVIEPRLLEALREFRRLPLGERYEWREPRRTRDRKFVHRRMTTSRTLRSRVQTSLRRAKTRLGLRSLRHAAPHHISMLADAVWTEGMESSPVPREDWHTRTEAARRARKSAANRKSEVVQFLSWAEWRGYLTLPNGKDGTLPDAWIDWVSLAEHNRDHGADVAARRVATLAVNRLQADSPERLVEIGFDRLEEEIRNDPSYTSERSVRTTLSRLRRGWNACADAADGRLPRWEAGNRGLDVPRREDGGLQDSWWSGKAFIDGRPCLLDQSDMEMQRRQARDMCDWWTLADPTLRRAEDGGPLPSRPERTRQGTGRKKFGARSESEITALKPLHIVSCYQRYALTYASPVMEADKMRGADWSDLFRDRARVRSFIQHVFEQNRAGNGGEAITAGVNKCWYVHTLMWAYFPAWLEAEITAIRERRTRLDLSTDEGMRLAQQLENERARLELEIEWWRDEAGKIKSYIRSLEADHGGVQPRKDRTEVRKHLSHRDVRRMADALKERRLEIADALRKRTARLLKRRERERDDSSPLPSLSRQGIAYEVMTRPYTTLIVREAMLRLHSILPWRPGTLRRAILGVHIDPDSLALVVRGRDDKVDRDGKGRLKKQEVSLPDLEWWEDPDEVEDTVRVLRLLIDEARPWLLAHPTKKGAELRRDGDERRLLLSSYGIPWGSAGRYTSAFRDALRAATKLVNERLGPGETPIRLPTGYASTGSYIMRFLYGQRIREMGGTFQDIADALGNSPATARRHYQDEQEGETINRIATRLREERKRHDDPESTAATAAELAALTEARAAFDAEVAALALDQEESARYWQARKKDVLAALQRN